MSILALALLALLGVTDADRRTEVVEIAEAIERHAPEYGRSPWRVAALAVKETRVSLAPVGKLGECGPMQVMGWYLEPPRRCNVLQEATGGTLAALDMLRQWDTLSRKRMRQRPPWLAYDCFAVGRACLTKTSRRPWRATRRLARIEAQLHGTASAMLATKEAKRVAMNPYFECDSAVLYHGDWRDVLPRIDTAAVDLVFTDPPYAISLKGAVHIGQPGRGHRRLDFFEGDDDRAGMVALATSAAVATTEIATSAYFWCGHRQFGPLVETFEARGWKARPHIWVKTCPPPPPPGSGWPSGAELCVYAWRNGRAWNHDGSNLPPSNVTVADAFRNGNPRKVAHPTQKPMAVILPRLRASGRGTVLDMFAGSGSTLVAARAIGLKSIGIEKEERYCEVAADRLRQGHLDFGAF